jgi:hypothetical protein
MKTPPFAFADPKQERSKQTLGNILDAVQQIVEEADPAPITGIVLLVKNSKK